MYDINYSFIRLPDCFLSEACFCVWTQEHIFDVIIGGDVHKDDMETQEEDS